MDAVRDAWSTPRELARDGASRLARGDVRAWALWALWWGAAVLDAGSTAVMMGTGYVEANPVVAAAMAAVGVPVVIALASAWVLVLGVVSLGRSAGRWSSLIRAGLWVILAVKASVGIANVVLACTGVGPW